MALRLTNRSTRNAVAVAATVLVALALTANPAHAADPNFAWACWDDDPNDTPAGGCGEFWTYGEHVRVRDVQADGWGTRAQIQKLLPDSYGALHWVNHSTACFDDTTTSNTNGGWTVCNYNVAENITVRLHVWASRDGVYKYHSYSPAVNSGTE